MSGTAGTIRTDAFMLNSQQEDGQVIGSFTLQRERDLTVSKVNVLDIYDDPSNTLALGAPAIVNGSAYLHKAPGLTIGTGLSQSVQAANFTAVQAFITAASVNKKYLEIIPNDYQIYSTTSLLIPTGYSFNWRGSFQSRIIQSYVAGTGVPVLTIGDITATNILTYSSIDGLTLLYAGGQTLSQTNADTLRVGFLAWSSLENIMCGVIGSGLQGYRGFATVGSNGSFFSNHMENIFIFGGLYRVMDLAGNGTGSTWDNVYLNGGSGSENWPVVSDCLLNIQSGGDETNFIEVNLEWASVNTALRISNQCGGKIEHLHCEGLRMTGNYPTLINDGGNNVLTFDQITMGDINFNQATTGITGVASIFYCYTAGQSDITVRKLFIKSSNAATGANIWDYPVCVNTQSNPYDNDISIFSLEGMKLQDSTAVGYTSHLYLDQHMLNADCRVPTLLRKYNYGITASEVEAATLNITSTYTHYGQYIKSTILVPATISPSFTITLAAIMGVGSNQKPATRNTVHICRQTGTVSGTLTVTNNGSALTTAAITSAAGHQYIEFDGANWVVINKCN